MAESVLHDWIDRQGVTAFSRPVLTIDPDGRRQLTLMNLVLSDDYGLEHKTSVAVQLCPPERAETPLAMVFDAPSNAFPEDYYARLGLTQVRFRARLRAATCHIRILRRGLDGEEALIAEAQGVEEVSLLLTLQAGGSRLVLRLDASADLRLDEAAWLTEAPEDLRVLGLSVTTYNKESYLYANLAAVLDSPPAKAGLLDILVVNNGRRLDCAPPGVTVLDRDNIGGTGGFRTAYEHFESRGFAHFLVMDDDILIAPDFINRIYALSCLCRGFHIGALAEIMNTPERRVKEQGAGVSKPEVMGLELHNEDLILGGPDNPRLYPVMPAQYGGWWGLLVDLSSHRWLPPSYFFIRRDDISFGVESHRANCPTLVFPNLHVTHAEIGAPTYMYYDLRNELVMRARLSDELTTDPWHLRLIANHFLVCLQIDRQKMLNLALRDFLKGPAHLESLDQPRLLTQLRQIAATPIAAPSDAPVLTRAEGRPGRAIDFLKPASYRRDPAPPVIRGDAAQIAGGLSGYFEPVAGTDKVYRRQRRLAGLLYYVQALILLRRLRQRLGSLEESYAAMR